MKSILHDVFDELKKIFTGTTLDAIFPILVFLIIQPWVQVWIAALVAIFLSLCFFILRLIQKRAWAYALFGFMSVVVAGLFSLLSESATNFFLPDLISTGLLFLISFVSVFTTSPIAIWMSHLTRNWPLSWYRRKDVSPAYRLVSLLITGYFGVRLIVLFYLFEGDNPNALGLISTLSGTPLLILVLVVGYIFGIQKLRTLQGPSVDEFLNQKQPPYEGQKKGF